VVFWSVTGQRIATYSLSVTAKPGTLVAVQSSCEYYFGGRLLQNAGGFVHADRLGSVGKYLPFGEDRSGANPGNGTEKFATYFRDSDTGLDYAVNRYESPGQGRFLTPDPYMASGGPSDPGSWNRYAYVGGDPINSHDPSGRFAQCPAGTHTNSAGTGCDPEVTDCSASWWLPECGGFSQNPEYVAGLDQQSAADLQYMLWMQGLANTWSAGLAEAANLLSKSSCSNFLQGNTANLGLGVATPADLLNLYVEQGFLTYSSDFRANGVHPGGGDLVFGGAGTGTSTFNTGGITTYATDSYVNSTGTRISVNAIFMNVNSFAFTGNAFLNVGGFTPVGQVDRAFAGLSQAQILALSILHELAHVTGAIGSDGGNAGLSSANSLLVRVGCFQ
jgi:RHS repeat-associated protein